MTQPTDHPTSVFAAFLSYLIPGLGQIYQGRVGKGLLFFVCLTSLFHVGHAMGNWQNVYLPPPAQVWAQEKQTLPLNSQLVNALLNRWHYPGQFWIGISAWPALWQFYGMPLPDAQKYPVLHSYQQAPREGLGVDEVGTVNNYLVNNDKTPDLGLMYTVIAGVLNILVIYDAFAGPAFPPSKKPKPPETPTTPTTEPAPT